MIPGYGILSGEQLQQIHEATTGLLSRVGVKVHHEGVLERLVEAGAEVDREEQVARIGEKLLLDCLARVGKQYTLWGRDGNRTARFGYGDMVTLSSPGQYAWVDWKSSRRRSPTTEEFHQAIKVGDALENIDIVGAMTQPVDVPEPIRDIYP